MRIRSIPLMIASIILLLLALSSILDFLKYAPLIKSRAYTEGIVSSLDCNSHASYSYKFSVNGKSFESSSNYRISDKNCAEQLGERFVVTFLPDDPSISTPENPENIVEVKKYDAVLLFLVFLTTFIISALMFWYGNTRKLDL